MKNYNTSTLTILSQIADDGGSGSIDHVDSAAIALLDGDATDRMLKVRFAPNESKAAKAPKFRASVYLMGPFAGLVTEFAVFESDGEFSVAIPGGRYPSLRAANRIFAATDGKEYESTLKDAKGEETINALPALIKTAFHIYQTTKQPEQFIQLP